VLVLRGLLDLERGAPADSERRLQESLALSRSAMDSETYDSGRPPAEAYLRRVRAGRTLANRGGT